MADAHAKDLIAQGNRLFSKKKQLDTLWQTLAEQFFPERADFTVRRVEGDEYAQHMLESLPAQNRRDLASAMGAILRPRGQPWFRPRAKEKWRNSDQTKTWLDDKGEVIRSDLYSSTSQFQMAWQDGDDDFSAFGNAVCALTEGSARDGASYFEHFHLRDCAWQQDGAKVVNVMHRKLKVTLANWDKLFPGVALPATLERVKKDNPFHETEVRHICLPRDLYEPYNAKLFKGKLPFVSVYVSCEDERVLREGGYSRFPYLVRRWRLAAGSQYGYSPAAMLGLVDARLLQSQAEVILEAGEKIVAPPLIGTQHAILGGINTMSNAVTWVDDQYDERLGAALRPLETGGNIPIGLDMKVDTRQILMAAWYLNKLNLPSDKDMTAYETRERVAEYIRSAGPIFEPFEADNARMLENVFEMKWRFTEIANKAGRYGPFGDLSEVPEELRGADVEFEFDTPISMAYARQKALRARETLEYVAMGAKLDPSTVDNYDLDKIARDGGTGIGGEAGWIVPVEIRDAKRAARAQQMQQEQAQVQAQQALETVPKAAAAKQGIDQMMQGVSHDDIAAIADMMGMSEAQDAEGMDDNEYAAAPAA